jgi:hypothetical protein
VKTPESAERSQTATFFCLSGLLLAFVAAIPFCDFMKAGSVFSFVPIMLLGSAFYFGAAHHYQFLPTRQRRQVLWWSAIILRLAALAIPAGDDMHRYLWEGRIQWGGFNPYLVAPDSPALAALRDADWQRMNHRDWAAIYPPGAELLLKLLTSLGSSALVIKIACAVADIGIIGLLLRLNTGPSRHRDTVWYAWNPLVIFSFAGAGHFDSLMLAPLLLAVYALHRAVPANGGPAEWRWAALAAFLLGVAISIKLVPLVLVPVLALTLRSHMFVLPLAAVAPWLTARYYGFPEVAIFDGFHEFSYVARFNDFIWWISERFIWENPAQKNGHYTMVTIAVASTLSLLARWDWRRAILWVLGATLICSTVVHPWYVTWILPFAAMQRARGWFVLSATVFLAYLWWESTPVWNAWQPSPLLSLAISVPPLVFCVYVIVKSRTHHINRNLPSEPKLQS